MSENPFGITRAEILEIAAQKMVNQLADHEELENLASNRIRERVDAIIKEKFNSKIDEFLKAEMDKIMSSTVTPINMWGEKTGEPTTIRDALAIKAKEFWTQGVDNNGNPSDGWGNTPRYQYLFRQISTDTFAEAVKQNITNLVGAFKVAMSDHATKITQEHIDKIIQVKTK